MRHNRDEKRFDRTSGHLKSMLSNMTNDLIKAGSILTTTPRAKVLRSYAERMITLGKSGTLAARRKAMAFMRNKETVTKLFSEVAPRYAERPGGYTRIVRVGSRNGDCAPMSVIELVEGKEKEAKAKPEKKAPKKAASPKKAAAKGAGGGAKAGKGASRKTKKTGEGRSKGARKAR